MMSTLPIHAPHIPQLRLLLPSFARLASFVEAALDVFAEADRLAGAARRARPAPRKHFNSR